MTKEQNSPDVNRYTVHLKAEQTYYHVFASRFERRNDGAWFFLDYSGANDEKIYTKAVAFVPLNRIDLIVDNSYIDSQK